jgi:hypothetical protein
MMKLNPEFLIYVLVVIASAIALTLVVLGQGFSSDPRLVYQGF